NLPFADASFDLVLGESVLELVSDQSSALRELHRVLRPGGRLVFSTPNRWSPGPDPHTGVPFTSWLPQGGVAAVARMRGILPPTRTLLSRVGLRRLLKLAGFHEVAIDPPEIPASLGAGLPAWVRAGIAAYQRATATPGLRRVAAWLAPMHIAAAQRPRANVR
ncbi:MAG: methyltransferase domain-containing protein, partial [Gemmatimonadaceae bacterium]